MDVMAPALATICGIMTTLMLFALGVLVLIALAYFTYLFTYYKKHLEKGMGVSVQIKVRKAALIVVIALIVVVLGLMAFPALQGMFASRVV